MSYNCYKVILNNRGCYGQHYILWRAEAVNVLNTVYYRGIKQ
jgi:hypothetical protein